VVSANLLLQKLQPYNNKKVVVVQDQTTGDIINGIIQTSKKYEAEYEKILPYFEDDDIIETAKNVFDFLKKNCNYVVESTIQQTLRSPASIIATGKTKGCDCKSYSLFFMGILSAYIKKYNLKNKISFRFAGYDGKDIGHVFVVFNDKGKEYWCDCVLDYFNDRSKTPTKYKDKNMALVQISGVPQVAGLDWTSIGKSRKVWNSSIGQTEDQPTTNEEDIKRFFDSINLSSFYTWILNTFDNSTGKWKSRLNNMRPLSPTQRLAWYMERANQKDNWDAVQYSQMFGRNAEHIVDQPNIPINWAVSYNDLLKKNYPNGITNGFYFPLEFLQFDLSKVNPTPQDLTSFDQTNFDKLKLKYAGKSLQELGNLWSRYKGGDTTIIGNDLTTGGGSTQQAAISTFALLGLIGAGVFFFLKGGKKSRK